MHLQAVEESGLGYWAQKETCTTGALQKVCEQVNPI